MSGSRVTRRRLLKSGASALGASALAPISRAENKADVVVIGAGLSGLYASMLLERAGLNVLTIEGSGRIGGRLFTLDQLPGKPEAGGQTIGPTYGRMLFLAHHFGADLGKVSYAPGPEKFNQILNVGGDRLTPDQWSGSKHNPFPEPYKSVLPDRLLMQVMGYPPFAEPNSWTSPSLFDLDISTAEFLKSKGFDQMSIDMMGISNNYGRNLEHSSLLYLHKTNHLVFTSINTPGGSHTVKGGNQKVPELMAASLNSPVQMNKKVMAIREIGNSVEVDCNDGSSYTASYVISSVPCTMLRQIDLQVGLPSLQHRAFNELTYSSVFQAHFSVVKPFWKGRGFMPNVWSDSLIERVFASDPEYTGEITNLTVWINGQTVDRVEGLSEERARELIEKDFYRVLPEAKGAVEFQALHSWGKYPFTQGAFSCWSPGQVKTFANIISQPAGRLHFAGEHTGQWSSGMEAALESGERAALEIIEKIRI